MTGKQSPPNIQRIQEILSAAFCAKFGAKDSATRDKEYRYKDMYRTMYNPYWIETAYNHIKGNKGSKTAGIDGVTKAEWETNLDNNLKKLGEELRQDRFKPLPVRRRYISKETSSSLRPLGIPALRDRIVQEAMRMVLDPIFEADFLHCSYGFRAGRGTQDAISNVYYSMTGIKGKSYRYIIEGDIKSYFEEVNHEILVNLIERRVNDKKMVSLIRKFLISGVMEEGKWCPTSEGVPQGGIISPLFSNIYLHELDKYMYINYTGLTMYEKAKRRNQGKSNYVYIRYADDFILLCNGTHQQAIKMKSEIKEYLRTDLDIELSDDKTLVTDAMNGFKFLGYEYRRTIGQRGMITKMFIPKRAKDKVRNKIAKTTSKKTYNMTEIEVAKKLNGILRGWGNYYKYAGNAGSIFSDIQHYAFWKYAHWLGRKHKVRHMSKILKPLEKGGRMTTSGTRQKPVKNLCGIGHKKKKVRVVKLFIMSTIRERKLKPDFKKPNPYLSSPKP